MDTFTDIDSSDLIRRNHELLNSLPAYIRYSEDMWMRKDPMDAFLAAQEHLDILYNEFMIRRTMVGRLGDNPTELVHLAHNILSTVLEASQIRGARGHNVGCVPWIVSSPSSNHSLRQTLPFPVTANSFIRSSSTASQLPAS